MRLQLVKIDATIPESGYFVYCDGKHIGAIEASDAQSVADNITNQEMNAEIECGMNAGRIACGCFSEGEEI